MNKPGWAPVKLNGSWVDPNGEIPSYVSAESIGCYSSGGPIFGGGQDISISDYASSNTYSYSDLGSGYRPPSGYSFGSTFAQTFLAGSKHFTPDEVETFYEKIGRNSYCSRDIYLQ